MTLEKAISCIIDKEGIAIISDKRFPNFLDDMQAYDTPAIKRIVTTMVSGGYFSELKESLLNGDYELHFSNVNNRLVQYEGYQPDLVKYVLDCILFAALKTGNVPTLPLSENSPQNTIATKKTSKTKKNEITIVQVKDKYLLGFEGQQYELDETQYKAIKRKQDMPADRLELWLKSYSDENK